MSNRTICTGFLAIVLLSFSSTGAAQEEGARIPDASIAPYDGMAQQTIRRRGFKSAFIWTYGKLSTGFFIGPRLLLTNAHNMHSPFGSRVVRYEGASARVDSTYRSRSRLLGRRAVRKACWIPKDYGWNDFPNDYCIVRFPEREPRQVTSFELALADTTVHVGDSVFVSGYPGETHSGHELMVSGGVITSIEEKTLHYTNWAETGSSGSPVWVKRDGRFLVVGVHAGNDGAGITAKKVDKAFMDSVTEWMNANAP